MTDNEIIKALECCKKAKLNQDCLDLKCPFSTKYGCNIDSEDLRNEALDLINRQKAEIEMLRNGYFEIEEAVIKSAKAEAVKEFAERLKADIVETGDEHGLGNRYPVLTYNYIDNLVKEMAGETA